MTADDLPARLRRPWWEMDGVDVGLERQEAADEIERLMVQMSTMHRSVVHQCCEDVQILQTEIELLRVKIDDLNMYLEQDACALVIALTEIEQLRIEIASYHALCNPLLIDPTKDKQIVEALVDTIGGQRSRRWHDYKVQ